MNIKKNHLVACLLFTAIVLSSKSQAQTYNFAGSSNPSAWPNYNYTLTVQLKITGFKILQVYSQSSFSYTPVISCSITGSGPDYRNTKVVNLSSQNFYTFQFNLFTHNPNAQSNFQNGFNNNLLVTDYNNKTDLTYANGTYQGNAATLGYVVGNTYSSKKDLDLFDYDSVTLRVAAPGFDHTAAPGPGVTNALIAANATDGTVLPVQLLNFTAQKAKSGVLLNWSTLTETNSSYFTIERSPDGINFVAIGKETASGNSNKTINYTSTDYMPLQGVSYYRIKETDMDGHITLSSNVVSVNTRNEVGSLAVYPNPVVNSLTIVGSRQSGSTISILNMYGQVLSQYVNPSTNIDVSNLASGTYILQSVSDGNKQTVKFLKK